MRILSIAMFGAFVLGQAASAGIITYDATLSGPGEFPPNASPGTGFAEVTIDTVLQTMRVQVSFSGLLGTTTASHIHCCTPFPETGTAGVATTTPTFAGFPLGVTAGTYDNTLDLTLASSYNPAFITAQGGTAASAEAVLLAAMAAGDTYLNIHTTVVPGGEIRGFLVPEPATFLMVGAALTGLAILRRRRAVRNC
jgi:CHRD domain